jgi:rubredoxin
MPLYLCEGCAHEFENSAGAISCDWCGGKELKVLVEKTEVEQMLDAIYYPMVREKGKK